MIKELLNGLLNMLMYILNIVLTPINLLIENLFPSLNDYIQEFVDFVNFGFGNLFEWFFNLIPPLTKGLLVVWLTFVIGYYGIIYTYLGIRKLWEVIQKIKFW